MSGANVWAIVLAAGEGTRLSSLTTTPGGLTVPKQFCSLQGGRSLLEDALARAEAVASRRHVVTVVAAHHRRWWEAPLWSLSPANVVAQPQNKGTAAGVLLPLLHILQRDPEALVVVLPADHFVRNEAVLALSLQQASRWSRADRRHVHLLGILPDEVDAELGYILPAEEAGPANAPVRRFVEKPGIDAARELINAGALWNAFILAASGRALLGLYEDRHPDLVAQMAAVVTQDEHCPQDAPATERLYPSLPNLDFSRDVLQGFESKLRVLAVPPCGWSDLGTPRRVAATLNRCWDPVAAVRTGHHTAYLSLADQHARRQHAGAAPVCL